VLAERVRSELRDDRSAGDETISKVVVRIGP
jgi:hypothetical protein